MMKMEMEYKMPTTVAPRGSEPTRDGNPPKPPMGTKMGSAPPPGQEKPVAGHGLGFALPVGAQNPGSTVRHCEAEVRPSKLP